MGWLKANYKMFAKMIGYGYLLSFVFTIIMMFLAWVFKGAGSEQLPYFLQMFVGFGVVFALLCVFLENGK
jgi:hypothetical protein